MTALCSAMFSSADPSAPARPFISFASSLRADRLESMSSSFSRSTIDVCQLPPPPLAAAFLVRTSPTSTAAAAAAGEAPDPAELADVDEGAADVDEGEAAAGEPVVADA